MQTSIASSRDATRRSLAARSCFSAPVKGAATRKAAQSGGLALAENVATLKVEGDDEAGLGGRISTAIADAGINLRGVSAAVIDKKFVAYFGFDSAADATKAAGGPKNPGESKESRERQALITAFSWREIEEAYFPSCA